MTLGNRLAAFECCLALLAQLVFATPGLVLKHRFALLPLRKIPVLLNPGAIRDDIAEHRSEDQRAPFETPHRLTCFQQSELSYEIGETLFTVAFPRHELVLILSAGGHPGCSATHKVALRSEEHTSEL